MGQYRTYRDSYLDKEIAEIERELIAYKSTQAYGAVQIQSRVCSTPSISATAVQVYSYTYYWILGRVTFSGVNKNRLARGALTWSPSAQVVDWYMCEASDSKELYEMKWYVCICGLSPFSIALNAHMNMEGKLTYESVL